MKTEKIATLSGIRLKIAAAGLSIACLGIGAALPAASHAFAPGRVGATTTATHPAPLSDHLLPFIASHSNGSALNNPQTTLV
jgi:hypothetical protein